MSKVDTIISELQAIAANPRKAMEDYKAATGKGAVGMVPVYTPDELVYAAGRLPIGCWGGQLEVSKARAYLPAFACSIMQSIMELECNGVYDDLEAVIFSAPCDTLKCMGQKWKGKCPSIQFVHPQNVVVEGSTKFLAKEYEIVKEKLEGIFGEKITDEAIEKAIVVYNEHRAVMREFCKVAADYPQVVDPIKRHAGTARKLSLQVSWQSLMNFFRFLLTTKLLLLLMTLHRKADSSELTFLQKAAQFLKDLLCSGQRICMDVHSLQTVKKAEHRCLLTWLTTQRLMQLSFAR